MFSVSMSALRNPRSRALLVLLFLGLNVVLFIVFAREAVNYAAHNSYEQPPVSARIEEITELGPVVLDNKSALRKCKLRIVNTSGKSVRFGQVTQNCSCSDVRLEKRQLAPGEETVLHVEISARGLLGPQDFHQDLVFELGNDIGVPWTHVLRTTAYPRAQFVPDTIQLGTVEPNSRFIREVELQQFGEEEPEMASPVRTVSGGVVKLVAKASEAKQLTSGIFTRSTTYAVHVASGVVAERHRYLVAPKDIKRQETTAGAQLSVSWTVRSLFDIQPSRLFLGASDLQGEKLERTVTLKRSDSAPLAILKVNVPTAWIQADTISGREAPEQKIRIRIDARSVEGAFWGEILVETNHPVQPVARIVVAALPKMPLQKEGSSQ